MTINYREDKAILMKVSLWRSKCSYPTKWLQNCKMADFVANYVELQALFVLIFICGKNLHENNKVRLFELECY